MNPKGPFSWSPPFKRCIASEILIIPHHPGPSSLILSKYVVFIFYFFLLLALIGYIFLSVYIFEHTSNHLLIEARLFRKKLYVDYYTLLSDSIEQLFIQSFTLPHQQKTTRYQQRFNSLQEQFPTGSALNCPTSGWISSHFGMRTDPVFEGTAFHKGIDIAAVEGTPVYCAADGIVDFCGNKPLLGNVVYIRHPEKKLITIYGHLRTCSIRKNRWVQKGQLLGHVGSTGKSTGPHLHFEVRHYGVPINPIPNLLHSDTLLD